MWLVLCIVSRVWKLVLVCCLMWLSLKFMVSWVCGVLGVVLVFIIRWCLLGFRVMVYRFFVLVFIMLFWLGWCLGWCVLKKIRVLCFVLEILSWCRVYWVYFVLVLVVCWFVWIFFVCSGCIGFELVVCRCFCWVRDRLCVCCWVGWFVWVWSVCWVFFLCWLGIVVGLIGERCLCWCCSFGFVVWFFGIFCLGSCRWILVIGCSWFFRFGWIVGSVLLVYVFVWWVIVWFLLVVFLVWVCVWVFGCFRCLDGSGRVFCLCGCCFCCFCVWFYSWFWLVCVWWC